MRSPSGLRIIFLVIEVEMKTLARVEDVAEIRTRIGELLPTDTARWGLMSVGEMVCHVREAYSLAMGEWIASPIKVRLGGPVLKWMALRVPTQWPKGVPTVPELKPGNAVAPMEYEHDVAGLVAALERFVLLRENRNAHAFFGQMEPWDWMRWGYLHADHHLRQFGR
jgi:hypothetical protein